MICTRRYNMFCVSEGIWDANVCLRTTCLTIAWCTVFPFQSHRSWAPKNTFYFVLSCKIHTQLQQWHILKTKSNISKHDRASQKQLMGLRYYLRSQDGTCWRRGVHAGSRAAVKPPSFVLLCLNPDLWGTAILPLPVEEHISLQCIMAVGSSPAGGCCNYSTLYNWQRSTVLHPLSFHCIALNAISVP